MLTACGIETLIALATEPAIKMVATVLTACGIETTRNITFYHFCFQSLQQCLPLAVLKPTSVLFSFTLLFFSCNSAYRLRYWNDNSVAKFFAAKDKVATVLTACGIETEHPLEEFEALMQLRCNSAYRLRYWNSSAASTRPFAKLQQCLPLAVLKL